MQASTAARCAGVVNFATSGCSGAKTRNVAPNNVSGRVVKTSIASLLARPASSTTENARPHPSERPIQLRCIASVDSGQSTSARSSSRRSE
jgi:hypothetical protein